MITYTVTVDKDATRWYLNGQYHRTDGPAIEWKDGYKAWFLNGKRHRIDGPAIETANGRKEWFLNGKHMGEAEHFRAVNPVKELTVAEIEALLGYSVKIVK